MRLSGQTPGLWMLRQRKITPDEFHLFPQFGDEFLFQHALQASAVGTLEVLEDFDGHHSTIMRFS